MLEGQLKLKLVIGNFRFRYRFRPKFRFRYAFRFPYHSIFRFRRNFGLKSNRKLKSELTIITYSVQKKKYFFNFKKILFFKHFLIVSGVGSNL
jgi:hypothetical protein